MRPMFRAPNLEAARARRKSGWESHTQRVKTEEWLRNHDITPPESADEAWELVLRLLLRPITGDSK